jgi:hypothetical protein
MSWQRDIYGIHIIFSFYELSANITKKYDSVSSYLNSVAVYILMMSMVS